MTHRKKKLGNKKLMKEQKHVDAQNSL